MTLPPWLTGISTKLAAGIALAVSAVFLVFAYLFASYHDTVPLKNADRLARTQAELVVTILEHAMLAGEHDLLHEAIGSPAGRRAFERMALLGPDGTVRDSNVPVDVGSRFDRSSPSCSACHDRPPAERPMSVLLELDGRDTFRTVRAIGNRSPCHQCHPSTQRVLGMLVLDQRRADVGSETQDEMQWFGAVATILAVVLFAVTILLTRVIVTRRVRELERAALALGKGDLARRVPVRGNDALTVLARQFNAMAGAVQDRLTEVQRLRAYVEAILDDLPIGLTVVDRDGVVGYANRMLRTEYTGIVGRPWREAFGEARPPTAFPAPGRRRNGTTATLRHTTPNGRILDLHYVPARGPAGEDVLVEACIDVTDSERLAQSLARAERLAVTGELAAGTVHAINNPLDGMRRALELIAAQPGNEARRTAMLEILRDGVERLAHVTGTLLGFARTDVVDVRRPVALNRIVEDAVQLLRLQIEPRAVALELTLDDGVASLEADHQGLHEVVVNLLRNAVDAVGQRGAVRLRTRGALDGWVELIVEDTGCGIPPENLSRLFDPFFTTKPLGKGTGLGLAIVRRIVEAHGGEILVRSTPGAGSTFTVRFPPANAGHVPDGATAGAGGSA